MKKVLILGANGQIAKLVTDRLLKETNDELTLYLRNSQRIGNPDPSRVTIIEGDVNDFETLNEAMVGQDIVYANLGGEFEPMAKNIVQVMEKNKVSRLIYVTGLGLYHEVPGEFGRWVEETIGTPVMDDTRRAAAAIENSTLNYTILRAAYMNNDPEVDYELTEKGEPYKGTIISRASIADLIVRMIKDPTKHTFSSLGISKPGTDGDRPMY
ncbi:SDR family oxidoreductase [Enterococcus lactis]|uniref:SDR family oxidoreductase n=1 Tax=Enterococcus lactis TaxID=357441 RepID=UPI0039A4FAE3